MNFSGLPDNFKAGTRGRAPDSSSNNIFGTHQAADGSRNNNTVDHHSNQHSQNRNFNQADEAANQVAHDKVMNEAQANKNRMKQESHIFGETTAQDFNRRNPYQQSNGQQRQQLQEIEQVNRSQSNQTRHQSHIFNDQYQAPQKMNQKRQGFNPITGRC
jgi:hypothetical protein